MDSITSNSSHPRPNSRSIRLTDIQHPATRPTIKTAPDMPAGATCERGNASEASNSTTTRSHKLSPSTSQTMPSMKTMMRPASNSRGKTISRLTGGRQIIITSRDSNTASTKGTPFMLPDSRPSFARRQNKAHEGSSRAEKTTLKKNGITR
ncbi:MAG: hypothetical protein IJM81_10995 [Prevotella sp.]|nr:hypothetical protein [Prevotella sp.]